VPRRAIEIFSEAEVHTRYQASVKDEKNVAAQLALGTLDVPNFEFVTPLPESVQLEVPNRADQGRRPAISHGLLQASETPRKLSLNLEDQSFEDKARSLQPVKFPRLPTPKGSFQTLRVWEGIVVGTGDNRFQAVLSDIEDMRFGRESGEFSLAEVSEDDRKLVQLGAVFYWYVGVRVSKARTLTEVSGLRFRRLPAWSTQAVKAAEDEAKRLDGLFGDKGTTSSKAES
jgi:hypothetical protein